MKARYSASLPEPFEIALQCLQFEKKVFVWKSMRTLGAILNLTEALSQMEHFMCTCGLTDLIHTCYVCSAYAVRVRYVWCSEAARTHCAFTQYAFAVCYWSAAVYHKHNIYPLFLFQIQTLLACPILNVLEQHCDPLLSQYSYTIFHRHTLNSNNINNVLNAFGF